MNSADIDMLIKPLTIKDLRVQTRVRGLSPAGSIDALRDKLKQAMIETGDFALKNEAGEDQTTKEVVAGLNSNDIRHGTMQNNYSRPGGQQNVGNFLSERCSSRVLAPPGGVSQIVFGDCTADAPKAGGRAKVGLDQAQSYNPIIGGQGSGHGQSNNNYSRPGGQNVGNMMTDRNSSRVLAPPGGLSSVVLG